ncbi:hypothetical protein LA345_38985 (plasmid) [Burkholderia vietnamiensis]|uniref:Uncharacterized protein n=1 Tax=Burkholderia vietnamiensis (strain G4 / LMG 22486) TaxID=269482 RepID=A4JWF7_BURVG|nr:hypothetical protein Bcep1808_7740 [Burkholderia vietnamiensis G4]MCB4349785.1 hypothetical protein [Burkholderia vietnamiensis]
MFDVNGLRGDLIISADLRYDLAPIPLTFEANIRLTQQTAADYRDGSVIKVNEIPFRIVKAVPTRNVAVQGKEPLSAVHITAFPDSVVEVARPRRTAVIFQNASLSGIYRACGASAPLVGDFAISRYACFVGNVPTFGIARVLQEESAVVMWRKAKLQAMNLRDLMAQTPIDKLDIDGAEDVKSDFLESDEVPVYVSVGPNGKFLSGARRNDTQSVAFSPRKDARSLNFMGRVLVRRKVITTKANPAVRAGDVANISGTPLVVMTAAHHMQNGTDGGGTEQYTRLWLGSPTQ